jgi:hypothetical protein
MHTGVCAVGAAALAGAAVLLPAFTFAFAAKAAPLGVPLGGLYSCWCALLAATAPVRGETEGTSTCCDILMLLRYRPDSGGPVVGAGKSLHQ